MAEGTLREQSIVKTCISILEMFSKDFNSFEKGKEMAIIYVDRLISNTLPDEQYSSHEYWQEVKEVLLSAKQ